MTSGIISQSARSLRHNLIKCFFKLKRSHICFIVKFMRELRINIRKRNKVGKWTE